MEKKPSYDLESLKVDVKTVEKAVEHKAKEEIVEEKQEVMSNRKAALVIVMLITMYAMISAIPTFVMMYFFDINFWISQLVIIIGTVIVTFAFGLHKPASNEQKLKSKFLL